MKWFWNRCRRHRETICLLASGALPEREKAEVENHLASCAGCQRFLDEMKMVTVPLANWEQSFARVEPDQALLMRWAKAVHAAADQNPVRPFTPKTVCSALWRELFWPCRHAWTGMAALWLVMWGINLGLSGGQKNVMAANSGSAPAMWQAIEEQRQLLAELIPPASSSQPAEPPRRNNPRPRSEKRMKWRISTAGDEVTSLKFLCA